MDRRESWVALGWDYKAGSKEVGIVDRTWNVGRGETLMDRTGPQVAALTLALVREKGEYQIRFK